MLKFGGFCIHQWQFVFMLNNVLLDGFMSQVTLGLLTMSPLKHNANFTVFDGWSANSVDNCKRAKLHL